MLRGRMCCKRFRSRLGEYPIAGFQIIQKWLIHAVSKIFQGFNGIKLHGVTTSDLNISAWATYFRQRELKTNVSTSMVKPGACLRDGTYRLANAPHLILRHLFGSKDCGVSLARIFVHRRSLRWWTLRCPVGSEPQTTHELGEQYTTLHLTVRN